MTIIAYITSYLLIGILFSFLLDLLISHYANGFHFSEGTKFSNSDKIFNTLIWPLSLFVFIKGFLGYYNNENEPGEKLEE